MLAVLAVMHAFAQNAALERAAWILVLGGGVGNLIDRIRTGVVVDYLNCLFINFPVFNFADVCICVGVGLLILSLLLDIAANKKQNSKRGCAHRWSGLNLPLRRKALACGWTPGWPGSARRCPAVRCKT